MCYISMISGFELEKSFLIIGFKSEIMFCIVINDSMLISPGYRSSLNEVLTEI